MTEREQIIEAQAADFADAAIESIDYMSISEDDEVGDYIDHGQLGSEDMAAIHSRAITRESFNPSTHVAISRERLEGLLEIEADAEYAALTAK